MKEKMFTWLVVVCCLLFLVACGPSASMDGVSEASDSSSAESTTADTITVAEGRFR